MAEQSIIEIEGRSPFPRDLTVKINGKDITKLITKLILELNADKPNSVTVSLIPEKLIVNTKAEMKKYE